MALGLDFEAVKVLHLCISWTTFIEILNNGRRSFFVLNRIYSY